MRWVRARPWWLVAGALLAGASCAEVHGPAADDDDIAGDGDTDTDTDTDADADTDVDVDVDADTDVDADGDSDADGDGDGDADTELCNGLDDDGDGQVDEGEPETGLFCDSGLVGACALGLTVCADGAVACQPNIPPRDEACDNPAEDDDCNGIVDDVAAVGAPCDTGIPGRCAEGTGLCDGLDLACEAVLAARTEQCANLVDDDCDGTVDEAECDDVLTCDELDDARQAAMDACLAIFPNCHDTDSAGVIGTTAGCFACNCDPIENWQMFCYATARDDYNCADCTLGEIQRSHEPCNCDPGTTPAIGTWCPQP